VYFQPDDGIRHDLVPGVQTCARRARPDLDLGAGLRAYRAGAPPRPPGLGGLGGTSLVVLVLDAFENALAAPRAAVGRRRAFVRILIPQRGEDCRALFRARFRGDLGLHAPSLRDTEPPPLKRTGAEDDTETDEPPTRSSRLLRASRRARRRRRQSR